MSLSGKLEAEVEIKAPPHLFHDVFSCRPHHINTMSPDKIHNVDLHDGDWGKEGTVIKWDYTHDGVKKVAKEIIEKIDDENLSTTFKVIEGDLLNEYKSFKLTVKASKKGSGSLVHWTLEYEKMNENIPDPHSLMEFCIHCSKDIDPHIHNANA